MLGDDDIAFAAACMAVNSFHLEPPSRHDCHVKHLLPPSDAYHHQRSAKESGRDDQEQPVNNVLHCDFLHKSLRFQNGEKRPLTKSPAFPFKPADQPTHLYYPMPC
jgi:hypothetical protein